MRLYQIRANVSLACLGVYSLFFIFRPTSHSAFSSIHRRIMMSHPLSPPRHLANLGLFSPSSSEEEISPAPKQPKDKKQPKETITDSNRCKYKTGKCLNIRTFKKNGSPHRLCLFHRQRANKIQRKFDRQKRQLTRTKSENVSELFRSSSMSLIPTFTPSTTPHDQSPLSAPPNMTGRNFAPNFIAQSFASKQQFKKYLLCID